MVLLKIIKDKTDFNKLEPLVISIATAREIITNLNKFERSVQSYKSYKENIVIYIRMLNLLKSKFNFANDKVQKN